jgi:hypothetical protein
MRKKGKTNKVKTNHKLKRKPRSTTKRQRGGWLSTTIVDKSAEINTEIENKYNTMMETIHSPEFLETTELIQTLVYFINNDEELRKILLTNEEINQTGDIGSKEFINDLIDIESDKMIHIEALSSPSYQLFIFEIIIWFIFTQKDVFIGLIKVISLTLASKTFKKQYYVDIVSGEKMYQLLLYNLFTYTKSFSSNSRNVTIIKIILVLLRKLDYLKTTIIDAIDYIKQYRLSHDVMCILVHIHGPLYDILSKKDDENKRKADKLKQYVRDFFFNKLDLLTLHLFSFKTPILYNFL